MPSGAKDDGNVGLFHPVHRAANIIDVGHHEIEMVQAVGGAGQQCKAMVQWIGPAAQERDFARHMIGYFKAQLIDPETVGICIIGNVQDNMAKPDDLRHGCLIGCNGNGLFSVIIKRKSRIWVAETKGVVCAPYRREADMRDMIECLGEFGLAFQFKADAR